MPTKTSRKSAIRDIVKEQGESLFGEINPHADEELQMGDIPSGPAEFARGAVHRDECVIDELLASVPKNQGYYLKLYRVVGPNQFELKERIDTYDGWSDLEWEVTSIVRHRTKQQPSKWGSGSYRVVIWREGGLRGTKYRPIDLFVDAQDPDVLDQKTDPPMLDPTEAFRNNMGTFSEMMNAMRMIMPQQVNPADMQKQMGDSFRQGLAASANESTQTTNAMAMMMTTMMTMMKEMITTIRPPTDVTPREDPSSMLSKTLSVMRDMGMMPQHHKEKSLGETMIELKAMGFDPFKQNDPLAQINQMKSIAGLLTDFMGAGGAEKPTLAEKLVDAIIPIVPSVLSNIKGLSDNYVQLQSKPQLIQPSVPSPPMVNGPQPPRDNFNPSPSTPQHETIMGGISGGLGPAQPTETGQTQGGQTQGEPNMLVQIFFGKVKRAVMSQDVNFFTELTQQIQNTEGGIPLLRALASGELPVEQFMVLVNSWSQGLFLDPQGQASLKQYTETYKLWLQEQIAKQQQAQATMAQHTTTNGNGHAQQQAPPSAVIAGKCIICNAEYEYDTEQQFEMGTLCDEQINGTECGGQIQRQ